MATRRIGTIPANKQEAANAALDAAGFGPDNFSVPIVPASQSPAEPPATHYACNWQCTDDEKAVIDNALSGVPGLVWRVLDSIDPAIANPTFPTAMSDQGLKRIPENTL